ncbi:hypothetical protein PC9H_001450 [Pleurotus ostreatus]|uniref:Uncharacterized protein n=1 Tax=Pleurotus ostreatus TaxID=5322 RepID=A0A8H7A6Y0_PLEOS|nr:uncharacterized protein PC9H_001450 [Pleurotus ostreatus]KAF7441101.1 hypothetical protein PC9H_001450 [Pleurotus ostreatus]KAJ8699416.1 hypothetical protein PTI98_002531 [Pleurotus ostreatus]
MQAASHGLWGFARKPNIGFGPPLPLGGNTTAKAHRSIHIPSFLNHAPSPKVLNAGAAQRLLSQTRNILTSFVAHLTAPGLGTVSPSFGRGMHTAVGRTAGFNARASIQQGFSFPARVSIGRPLHGAPYLPRAPVTPRSVMQVGLGTARQFSTGRPIFQHLVENVPVAGRAFYEADWEVKLREEREMMVAKHRKEKKAAKRTTSMLKPRVQNIIASDIVNEAPSATELDTYFPLPEVANVTTYLLIPLAPTPTSRIPLSATITEDPFRFPLREIGRMHTSYTQHRTKVSSLFTRLDAGNVWSKNVTCSAYSHGAAVGDGEGVCTILKVEFVGWTKAEVRSVIGESGTGWCVLEEVTSAIEEDRDDTDSILSGMTSDTGNDSIGFPPSQSFVMPTLDLSQTSGWSSPPPELGRNLPSSIGSDFDFAEWSDSDPGSLVSSPRRSNSPIFVDPPSENGYFGFSSDFLRRRADTVRDESDPWEDVFS